MNPASDAAAPAPGPYQSCAEAKAAGAAHLCTSVNRAIRRSSMEIGTASPVSNEVLRQRLMARPQRFRAPALRRAGIPRRRRKIGSGALPSAQ